MEPLLLVAMVRGIATVDASMVCVELGISVAVPPRTIPMATRCLQVPGGRRRTRTADHLVVGQVL
jgi:hypothetical protein